MIIMVFGINNYEMLTKHITSQMHLYLPGVG